MTPSKDRHPSRSQIPEIGRVSENINPNSPLQKSGNSHSIGSAKLKKSAPKDPIRISSFQSSIQERRFVVAKKNSKRAAPASVTCNCKEKPTNSKKCPCIAYENLHASQEEFFRARVDDAGADSDVSEDDGKYRNREAEKNQDIETMEEAFGFLPNESKSPELDEIGFMEEAGSSKMKRMRNRLLEDARNSIPESGRVMHLVKAFESILSIPNSNGSNEIDESKKCMKWALPGLHGKVPTAEVSSLSSSDLFITLKNFNMDSRVYSSFHSSNGSIGSRTSGGGRSRQKSSESLGRAGGKKWEKQLKVTSLYPFKLRTEQRGRFKKEEFHKKVEQMMEEEKKQRIPIAQGLPWTTDEPERLVKPPVKESTKPVDLKLHSDLRAVERAEFDNQVAEKISLMDQYRLERERQLKMEEEEEIRRLRKELVPRAQPMPYFDRPFIPKRSLKNPTIPKEPKFHNPQHKKIKCMSWNDINLAINTDEMRNGKER
ncbi:microtubule-destabilizing protein 60-like [Magnolia sinica]|uniref:microtubule-destabilizing protein 60-like n=1 Tax=Magnolia sinica TaxID=86752 RepID=UPI002658E0A1|nr:microtubule-destabilizing protein 60-like [Magnolia sinica]